MTSKSVRIPRRPRQRKPPTPAKSRPAVRFFLRSGYSIRRRGK